MTLPLRRVVFWMHLSAGVLAGTVVLIMSVTGVLLTYEKQMIRWADGYRAAPAAPGQPRVPLETALARATAAQPAGTPATLIVRRHDDAPLEVTFGREGSVFVHPYTGEVLGTGSARARTFFRTVTEWHRYLGRRDGQRAAGKAITGASNLAFLFLVLSGFYLWWPRTWTWAQFRQVIWFRRGLGSKARDFNWHHVIGYWSLVPLAVIVWSGVVIGYPWASNLIYRLAGEAPPAPPSAAARPGAAPGAAPAAAPGAAPGAVAAARDGNPTAARRDVTAARYQALDTLVARAAAQSPAWTILNTRLPGPRDAAVTITVDTGTGAQPHKRGTLVVDRASGEPTSWGAVCVDLARAPMAHVAALRAHGRVVRAGGPIGGGNRDRGHGGARVDRPVAHVATPSRVDAQAWRGTAAQPRRLAITAAGTSGQW